MNLNLPILEQRDEILKLIRENQVVIVCGDTGSGKTTQLPQIAMALGLGADGKRIACTQPRRLAAVTVAERVAGELQTEVGGLVGYQHRYEKKVSDETRIKFMTDGVLLAETRADPMLNAYDTIILDEAHERTLNIDFLLGILKRILARRDDLKVIVSSATIDTEKFSAFFNNAPTITVPGRLYPIEMVYRPTPDGDDPNLPHEISEALRTLPPQDDVLVFLPGERDIRETADYLARSTFHRDDDVIPLLASLPAGEQKRAFQPSAKRRVILATNVAETSVTIPGIRAVIDSGLARLSRYIHRTQVQRLQIEPISQASARQRAGRCGRIAPGTCIRLYSEEDFNRRDAYTPPEVLRASLAGVILALLDLRLGEIEAFPFLDPPKPAMIREGLRELLELGAVHHTPDGHIALTKEGFKLARIPVEPRLARMMLTASQLATLPSVIPLVAHMSCDEPRRRPVEEKDRADQAHASFKVNGSDFLTTLALWQWWDNKCQTQSQTQLRKVATKTYLSYPKMREWRDLVRQLTDLAQRLKLDVVNDNGGPDALHRALLSGLLSRLGHLDPETLDYRGAHALRFDIHPASVIKRKAKPEWIVAGELVDTSRLFARQIAVIDSNWIEPLAGRLCKYSYREPTWDKDHGFVRAIEQVTLYGLVLVPSRRRDYSRIDPKVSRELFLRHALVRGEFPQPPPAVRENLRVLSELKKRAERFRQPELFDEARLAAHFDAVIPPHIVSTGVFKKWLYDASPEEHAAFRLNPNEWFAFTTKAPTDYPDFIQIGNKRFPLTYRHTPDNPATDGITCTAQQADVPLLKLWRHDWLVPGALPEKVAYLLSALPNSLRRALPPVTETLTILLPLLKPGEAPLVEALRQTIKDRFGIPLPADVWEATRLPPHLTMHFQILGKTKGGAPTPPKVHTTWDFGPVAERLVSPSAGWTLTQYPALYDEGNGVTVRLFKDPAQATIHHVKGVTRLLYLQLHKSAKPDNALWLAIREAAVRNLPVIRTAEVFEERLRTTRLAIQNLKYTFTQQLEEIESRIQSILDRAEGLAPDIYDDIETQIAYLTYTDFAKTVPLERLNRYLKYLHAIELRIYRAKANPGSDRKKMKKFQPFWELYLKAVQGKPFKVKNRAALIDYRWLLEEYRISLFAQEVKTLEPINPERLHTAWREICSD